MTDKENVIKGLECCIDRDDRADCYMCYQKRSGLPASCRDGLMADALVLLKEQEVVVKCKDCRNWDKTTEECSNLDSVCFRNGRCRPDWFCADGEKAVKWDG